MAWKLELVSVVLLNEMSIVESDLFPQFTRGSCLDRVPGTVYYILKLFWCILPCCGDGYARARDSRVTTTVTVISSVK